MRIIILLLIALPTFLIAQNKATIVGTISNNTAEDIEFIIDKHYVGEPPSGDKMPVLKEKFTYSFSTEQPVWVKVRYNQKATKLYVEPNDSINLTIFDNNIDSIKLAGKGAANNQFWAAFEKEQFNVPDKNELKDKMKTSSIDAWEIFLFNKKRDFKKFFQENQTEYSISYNFEKYLKEAWDYYYLSNLMKYPIERAQTAATPLIQRVPEIMFDVIDEKEISKNEAIINPYYRDFLNYFVRYKAAEENSFNKFEDRTLWLRLKQRVAEKYFDQTPLQFVLADMLYDNGMEAKKSTAKNIFKTMRLVNPESGYHQIVEEKMGEWMANEDENEPKKTKEEILAEIEADREEMKATDGKFRLPDLEGNMVAIEDFAGKVIYLDVWASWCGPCIKQMPAAKALKEKLTPEQLEKIVFLYISIDDHESRWKGAIEKHGIKGTHLRSPGGWKSEVTKKFGIRGIPRFILFDKYGKVVALEAKRPSDETLYNDLVEMIEADGPDIEKPSKKDNKNKGDEKASPKKKKDKKKKKKKAKKDRT